MEIMNTRLPKKDIYTKDCLIGLSRKCDWFINKYQFLNVTETENPKTIFLSAYRGSIALPFFVNEILPKISNNFVLIIASEDYTFPNGKGDVRYKIYSKCQNSIKKLLESQYLSHIFVENLDTRHVKMTPIPLGLLYPKINLDIESSEYNNIDFTKRNIFCLSRHRTRNGLGQWKDRGIVNNLCKTKWSKFVKVIDKEMPKDIFMNKIRNSKFCLCIHGGGYDPCPRFFESILYGAIPIIQHSPLDSFLKNIQLFLLKI